MPPFIPLPSPSPLPPLPLEAVTEATLAADLLAWKTNPPDPAFALILQANPTQD